MKPTQWLAAREAWSLAKAGYAGEPRLKLLRHQIRWAFAATANSKEALEWFLLLHTPELRLFADLNRRLALKPLRVYMSNRWGIGLKIKVIRDTYKFIQLSGSPLQNALTRSEGVCLARISIAGYDDVRITLGYDNTYRKEGELVVSLWCAELGGIIVSLAFSFEQRQNGEWAMLIGCIQGQSGIDNKPLSKAMHGIWPKACIVYIAQEIASSLGISSIYGVGNEIHSHKKKHIIHISSLHGFSFDYDSLWTDAGGKPTEDGWFDIPLQLQRRSFESMKSNKRSMYTRRYAMLDDIAQQILSALLPER